MFGLTFLFGAALWALPLAGLPILLHMLFRRKSTIILFSTLRFIKSSIQQTAARRRIQRWILLTCRVLLLGLLIWAIAQPVRILASGWFETGKSMVAAVVIDTSYSMQLKQQEMSLLDKGNDIFMELLREPLKNAEIAVFQSEPPDKPELSRKAADIQSQWTGLKPQAAPRPLADRYAAAIAFLSKQAATQKWLVVISDLQSREFPAPLPSDIEDARVVLFDLRPEKADSRGIVSVQMEPEQPVPGLKSTVVVELTGSPGDAAFFNLNINRPDGTTIKSLSTLQARFESSGRAKVRVPMDEGLPAERWLMVGAQLQKDDDMAWDNSRYQLVELPARQTVTFIGAKSQSGATLFLKLALDPWEGARATWPLAVKQAEDLTGTEHVVVLALTDWPSAAQAGKLLNFVRGGGTLITFMQPGLEQTWAKLDVAQQKAITPLLPAALAPTMPGGGEAGSTGTYRVVAPVKPHRVLQGVADAMFWTSTPLTVRRFVPFAPPTDAATTTVLHLSPASGDSRTLSYGFAYHRPVGSGQIFTWASMPDGKFLSPAVHPSFMVVPVNMALRPPEQRDTQNVELGQPLVLSGSRYAKYDELEVVTPSKGRYQFKPLKDKEGRFDRFVYPQKTSEPGLYFWRRPGDPAIVAISNVQLPAAESDLIYKDSEKVITPGPNCLVARSFAELAANMKKINEPQPRWTWPIAMVLLLLCAEALLGSLAHLWKPMSLSAFLPKMGAKAG